jgi:hypothetical protein
MGEGALALIAPLSEEVSMITREQFEQGLTWDEYLGGIQKNQDLFKAKYEEVEISPEDRAFFRASRSHLRPGHQGRLVSRCLITCRSWRVSRR